MDKDDYDSIDSKPLVSGSSRRVDLSDTRRLIPFPIPKPVGGLAAKYSFSNQFPQYVRDILVLDLNALASAAEVKVRKGKLEHRLETTYSLDFPKYVTSEAIKATLVQEWRKYHETPLSKLQEEIVSQEKAALELEKFLEAKVTGDDNATISMIAFAIKDCRRYFEDLAGKMLAEYKVFVATKMALKRGESVPSGPPDPYASVPKYLLNDMLGRGSSAERSPSPLSHGDRRKVIGPFRGRGGAPPCPKPHSTGKLQLDGPGGNRRKRPYSRTYNPPPAVRGCGSFRGPQEAGAGPSSAPK